MRRDKVLIRRNPSWEFFSVERADKTPAAAAWLVNNLINDTFRAPSTHYELVKFICSSARHPVPVVELSEDLRSFAVLRGLVCSAMAGELFDEIAESHDGMEWWVTDEGLHMAVVPPISAVPDLPAFDQFAGPLVIGKWDEKTVRRNTRLTEEALQEIAVELDNTKVKLFDVLRPKQREGLMKYNELMSRNGINTFEALAKSDRFSRILRRRLYVARQQYIVAAAKAGHRTRKPIPKVFYSANPIMY